MDPPLSAAPLPDPTRDVGLGTRVVGCREDLLGVPEFHEIAQVEKGRSLRDTGGLWHECVTMTIVKLSRSSSINSSMRAVAMGSRAEHGSSIRITSGCTAIARAMQSRCC